MKGARSGRIVSAQSALMDTALHTQAITPIAQAKDVETPMKNLNQAQAAWERQTENERSMMEEEREDIIDRMYDIARGPWMPKERKDHEPE